MHPQLPGHSCRQDRDPVLATLAIPDDQFATLKGQILHPQTQRFRQPQATTVKQLCNQQRRALQTGEH
jgi:hypothetical protein